MGYSALPNSNDIRPDAGRLWAGGFATAIVAALIALVGVLICRWTLGIPILAPQSEGAWGDANTGWFALTAVLVALAATGILHLLMLGTPDAGAFMKWIIGLVTLAAVVYPFSTSASIKQKAATAVVCLVLGIAIGSLLTAVAGRAVRRVNRNVLSQGYPPRGYDRGAYGEPPRGYDDRGGYPDRNYDRGGQGYGGQGYDRGDGRGGYVQGGNGRGEYDRGGYEQRGGYDRGGYDRGGSPTRQYPPQDRWS
jgi:hypothetical protein